jgi:hypothetical protein
MSAVTFDTLKTARSLTESSVTARVIPMALDVDTSAAPSDAGRSPPIPTARIII